MEILLGTLAYLIGTFPYAFLWHMKLFREKYEAWHYFGKNPMVPLGFLAMVFQGVILSSLYGFIDVNHASIQTGIVYALVIETDFRKAHCSWTVVYLPRWFR